MMEAALPLAPGTRGAQHGYPRGARSDENRPLSSRCPGDPGSGCARSHGTPFGGFEPVRGRSLRAAQAMLRRGCPELALIDLGLPRRLGAGPAGHDPPRLPGGDLRHHHQWWATMPAWGVSALAAGARRATCSRISRRRCCPASCARSSHGIPALRRSLHGRIMLLFRNTGPVDSEARLTQRRKRRPGGHRPAGCATRRSPELGNRRIHGGGLHKEIYGKLGYLLEGGGPPGTTLLGLGARTISGVGLSTFASARLLGRRRLPHWAFPKNESRREDARRGRCAALI